MSNAYEMAVRIVRLLLRVFFKDVEVLGRDRVPTEGGGLIIAWHPNGLIDPALIVAELPRKVVFGARHGLLKWPILGQIMRSIGTVPIYRAIDLKNMSEDQRRSANAGSVTALAQAIADGSFAALFPEGVSHDAPFLQQLKTGAARLFHQARSLNPDAAPPHIIPVGLHYDKKHMFRSRVLVEFHEPLVLTDSLLQPPPADEDAQRARYREMTKEFERVLRDTVHATESWDLHRLMHRARSLIRAERADRSGADLSAPSMVELAAGFRRIWAGYYAKKGTHPAEVASLLDRVQAYDNDIRALRLHDHELNRTRTITEQWKPVVLILQAVLVYVIIPPILLIGYVVNAPVYFGLNMLTQRMARADKDEASIKLLGGMVFYPLAWLIVALLVALGVFKINALYPDVSADPLTAGVTVFLFSAIGGVIALLYLEMLRETWRGLRTTLTRRQRWLTIEHLRLERAALHDDLTEFASDVELPGELLPDGRILPEA